MLVLLHCCFSLLQDSALICRYAVLRAAALHLPYAQDLYGPGLTLTPIRPGAGAGTQGGGAMRVTGGDAQVQELEHRLAGTLGIEVSTGYAGAQLNSLSNVCREFAMLPWYVALAGVTGGGGPAELAHTTAPKHVLTRDETACGSGLACWSRARLFGA